MKNSWLVKVCLRLLFVRKARLLYSDITRDTPGSSAEEFRASKGWFRNFKREQGFTAWLGMEKLPVQIKMLLKILWRSLKDFVDRVGFISEQVFNCDETGLF